MGGSASGGVSESSSKPLTADERSRIFQGAMQNLSQMNPNYISSSNVFSPPQYSAPGYVSPETVKQSQYTGAGAYSGPGSARTLSNGDYDRLQQSMLQGNTAGLDAAWKNRSQEIDQDMANRGVWASGIAEQAKQKDYAQNWTPAYQQAAAQATQQRYGLQNQEQQGLNALDSQNANARNTYNLANSNAANTYGLTAEQLRSGNAQQNANARNTFNLANSNAGYQSMWQPLNYLAGIWNGTGGQTSNSSSINASGGFTI